MSLKKFIASALAVFLTITPTFAAPGPWVETKTPILAAATFTGESHYLAPLGSGSSGASLFGAQFYADQDGTAYIDVSDDGVTWLVASVSVLSAGETVDLSVPLRSAYYRTRFVNGGTNQGAFSVLSNQNQSGAPGQLVDGLAAGSGGGGGGGGDVNLDEVGGNATATGNGATNSGTQRVTLSNDSTGQVTANLGTLNGAATAANQATLNTAFGGTSSTVCATSTGSCDAIALLKKIADWLEDVVSGQAGSVPAGTAIIGKFGIDQTTPGTTNNVTVSSLPALAAGTAAVGTVAVSPTVAAASTPYGLQSAASTNATSVKASAGVITAMTMLNTTTTTYYLRTYNLASAPTCSSATGFVRTWPIPPGASAGLVGGVVANPGATGTAFSTGIAFCLTGGGSSTDNTNAATGVYVNIDYK